MTYDKQIGLTGKTVSPKIYIAIGISGAVQHTCAIEGAETIIAINSDKNARIFEYADYGILTTAEELYEEYFTVAEQLHWMEIYGVEGLHILSVMEDAWSIMDGSW